MAQHATHLHRRGAQLTSARRASVALSQTNSAHRVSSCRLLDACDTAEGAQLVFFGCFTTRKIRDVSVST